MKQIIGYLNSRLIGPRVKPRWIASGNTVSLVANGGTGQVMLSFPLALIQTRSDLNQAVARVLSARQSVPEFMDALNQAFKMRTGKTVEEFLRAQSRR